MGMASVGSPVVLCCGSNCASVLGGEVLDCDVEWSFAPCPTEFRAPNSASKCLWRPVLHLARGLQQSAGNLTTCPHSWTISWAAGLQCDSVLKSFNLFSRKKNFSVEFAVRELPSLPPGKPCFCRRRQVWVWAAQLWGDFRRKHLVSLHPRHSTPALWLPWISPKLCIILFTEESREKQQCVKTLRLRSPHGVFA